jgi:cardiolipin synthase
LRQLPNLVTILRLALAPVVIWLILDRRFGLALSLFAVAGASDALDGYLARRLGAASRFGALADPLADKLLLSCSFPALSGVGLIPWWLTAVVIGRDVLILLGALTLWKLTPVRDFPPSVWGKLSTLIQIATVLAVLAQAPVPVLYVCFAATAGATSFSGVDYARRAFQTRA